MRLKAIQFRLLTLLPLFVVGEAAAHAETDKGDVAAGSVSQGTSPPGVVALREEPDEIVVTADRRGEAAVASESEFNEDEIASHGADSIQDLMVRLAPFIGNDGEEPVVLINGKPVGFDRSILFYPPEALERLAVLKPEAAAHYGERPGQRVVNLVLKKNFSTWDADTGINFATAGGRYGGSFSVRRTAINGDIRWNVQAGAGGDSALFKSARRIPAREGVFDSVGFIAAPGGGEIDPALSLAVGRPVLVAAIPPGTRTETAILDDFVATANMVHAVDPNRFETLQPSQRNASMIIGITRPFGRFSASLNLNAGRNSSDGLRGLPMASVILPAGHPSSPFAEDVLLTRPLADERPLRTGNDATSAGASLSINGAIGGWQTSVGISYSRNWTNNLLEAGIDTVRAQALIDAADPRFNPFGVWDDSLLIATRSRTNSENLGARLNVRKTVAELPAGPVVWTFTALAGSNRTEGLRYDAAGALVGTSRILRRHSNGQMTIAVPISRRAAEEASLLGNLSAEISAAIQAMTRSSPQKRFGGNLSWSPSPVVQFRASIDYVETVPSFEQLDAPFLATINRIFDYVRQEVAEPVWITGGNPDLRRGRQQALSIAASVRPLGNESFAINMAYRQSVAKGGVAAFPELTPVIEAAFPERVTRDGEGRLVSVDARAINIARDTNSDLSTGVALRLGQTRPGGQGKAPADPLQFSVSLNHRWRLKDELQTHPGLPVIDQLAGSGQSRHNVSLQVTAGKRGIGATINGNWSSPAKVANGDERFRFKPPMLYNLSLFVEPDRLSGGAKKRSLFKDLKLSLDVQNLFNGYRRVTLEDGSVPQGYSRDEIDPLGRTVRLTVRKKF